MGETTQIEYSACASLVALGVQFQHLNVWAVVKEHVIIKQKVRQHQLLDKLLDCFINILAGGNGLVEINTRVRPDCALQLAFGRPVCAEQSTVSRTLNTCTAENVTQMRTALKTILRLHGRSYRHDYEKRWQVLDVDLTGMPAGRQGEGVTSGYFPKEKNRRGRQLGRVLATLALDFLHDHPRRDTARGRIIPVLYIETPSPATVGAMVSVMLYELGDPAAYSGTQTAKEIRLIEYLRACRTRLIILDDFHHLYDSETNRILERVSDWLKVVIKQSKVMVWVIGIDDKVDLILRAPPRSWPGSCSSPVRANSHARSAS